MQFLFVHGISLFCIVVDGTQVLACNTGYSLLSCGMERVSGDDRRSYSIPISPEKCESKDSSLKATGYAWCSNSVSDFQIVKTIGLSTERAFSAQCPPWKKVIGCHMYPHQNTKETEEYGDYYPSEDGSMCFCYHRFGADCIATCASNIIEYKVVSTRDLGSGMKNVTCPGDKFVLGCGFYAFGGRGVRSAYVSSLNTCTCHDYKNGICYAICGKFN